MPIIKVWCLPNQSEELLRQLHQAIVAAAVSIPELKLKSEQDMTCLFPPDQMQYGLGSEIVIEVTGLFARRNRTPQIKKRLARKLGEVVKILYPDSKVECFVSTFNPRQDGFWSSE